MSKGKYLVNCPFRMDTLLFTSLAQSAERRVACQSGRRIDSRSIGHMERRWYCQAGGSRSILAGVRKIDSRGGHRISVRGGRYF